MFFSGVCSEILMNKLSKSRVHSELFRANEAD